MENRAAVFTSDPQAVEVYQSGAWWPGELLGWRHDPSGSCQVWVRVVLGGADESAWTDLTALRLPETHVPVRAEDSSTAVAAAGMTSSRLDAASTGTVGTSDTTETASLPLVRDLSTTPRRRAAGVPAGGGRRRAPETAASAPAPAVSALPRGRHRAPAEDLGRHRAADTGFMPPLIVDDIDTATAQRPAVVPAGRSVRPVRTAQAPETVAADHRDGRSPVDPEPDLLTRPMRLSDLGTQKRSRPRLDGFLASV